MIRESGGADLLPTKEEATPPLAPPAPSEPEPAKADEPKDEVGGIGPSEIVPGTA